MKHHSESAFDKIMSGLVDAAIINEHKYWVLGVFHTRQGKEYNKLLFSGDSLEEAEEKADEFAHSSAITLKPSRVFIQEWR